MITNSDLKPCPFCGGKPTREHIEPHKHHFSFMPDYPGAWIINCEQCDYRLFSHESVSDVENKWNLRTGDSGAELEEKGIEKALAVISSCRENICPGGSGENRQYEEAIVQPHLDGIAEELENLIIELREGGDGK